MLKKQSKKLAILLVLSMIASLFVGVGSVSAANGVAVSVSRVVTVKDDAGKIQIGNLQIKEDGDYPEAFETGDSFVLTLPSNLKWQKDGNEYAGWFMVEGAEVTVSGNYTMTVKITTATPEKDTVIIPMLVNFDGVEEGYAYIKVDGMDSPVPSGDYAIAQVLGGGTNTTVTNTFTTGPDTNAKFSFRITESTVGTMAGATDSVKFTLPKDVDFDTIEAVGLGGAEGTVPAGIFKELCTSFDGNKVKFNWASLKDYITFPVTGENARAIVEFNCTVNVDSKAKEQSVDLTVEGSDDIKNATVNVGKIAEYGVSISAEDTKTVLAGKNAQKMGTLVIYENVADTITLNRSIEVSLPDGVKFSQPIEHKDIKVKKNNGTYVVTDSDESGFTVKLTDGWSKTTRTQLKVDFDKINVEASFTGDVVVKIEGRAGVEGEVVIGTVIPAVEVAIDTVADVKIGFQGQAAGNITIKETQTGAFREDGFVYVCFQDKGISFEDKEVKVDVTEGNADIKSVKVYEDGSLSFVIDDESSANQPSTITISGISLKVDRTVVEGPVKAYVCGSAICESYEGTEKEIVEASYNDGNADLPEKYSDVTDYLFKEDEACRFVAANCVTPGSEEAIPDATTATSTFVIGSTVASINGAEVSLPVAPYISNSRTLCPVRYIAYACGITEANVVWNPDNQTVTLLQTYGTVVQLTIGSTTMLVNGVPVIMDVAPEITGGYTFLPARYVANAFGFDALWEAATKTVTITPAL